MEYKDYYKILAGRRRTRLRAFRKLARKFHPDVSKEPTSEARYKEISEAYEVLGDVEKRATYDQLGKECAPLSDRRRLRLGCSLEQYNVPCPPLHQLQRGASISRNLSKLGLRWLGDGANHIASRSLIHFEF